MLLFSPQAQEIHTLPLTPRRYLRASEVGAEIVIKATKTNGVYDKDPFKLHSDAVRYDEIKL